jgi:hypothetical protein
MNGIKVNGEFLELFPDANVDITLRNPIFADDQIIPGSYSIPFNIPFGESSPKNTRILGNLQVIENVSRLRETDAYCFYDGLKFKKGKLVIGDIDHQARKLEVNFKFGLTTLDGIKTTKLSSVVDETIVLNNLSTYVKEVELEPNFAGPFGITINGRAYEEATIAALVATINADTTEPRVIATDHGGSLSVKPFNNPTDIETPFTVDHEDGRDWVVTTNDETWNAPVRTAIEPCLAAPYPHNKFRFPLLMNVGQYEAGWQFMESPLINLNDGGNFRINEAAPEGDSIVSFNPFVSIVWTNIAPYVMLKHVLDKIATHYNFVYEGDFYTHDVCTKGLIYTPNTLGVKVPFIGKYNYIFLRQSFNISEFVPDLTVTEFFKALQTKFCLAVYYKENEKRMVMRFRKTITGNRAYNDITRNCSAKLGSADIGLKGIKLEIDRDDADALCPVDSMLVGTVAENTITTKCYGLSSEMELTSVFQEAPAVKQAVSAAPYKFLRLFFFEGEQLSLSGATYSRASNKLPDGLSLTFQDGLYDRWWKDWCVVLMKRKVVRLSSSFSFAQLTSIDWETKTMYDRVKYFYDQIDLTFTNNPNAPAKCKTSIYKS